MVIDIFKVMALLLTISACSKSQCFSDKNSIIRINPDSTFVLYDYFYFHGNLRVCKSVGNVSFNELPRLLFDVTHTEDKLFHKKQEVPDSLFDFTAVLRRKKIVLSDVRNRELNFCSCTNKLFKTLDNEFSH